MDDKTAKITKHAEDFVRIMKLWPEDLPPPDTIMVVGLHHSVIAAESDRALLRFYASLCLDTEWLWTVGTKGRVFEKDLRHAEGRFAIGEGSPAPAFEAFRAALAERVAKNAA